MALQVRNNLRTNSCKSLTNPSFIHLFSSKSVNPSEPNDPDNPSTPPTTSQSSISSSYFSDVKASLKQPQPPASPSQSRKFIFSSASSANSFQSKPSIASLDEIRKNLSDFRQRSSRPPPPPNDWYSAPPSSSSFSSSQNIPPREELFQRNAMKNSNNYNVSSDSMKGHPGGGLSFQAIRESLQQLKATRPRQSESKGGDSMSLSAFRRSLKLKPPDSAGASSSTMVIGGTEKLPSSVFGKEMMERRSTGSPMKNTEFVRTYGPVELGEKLRKLRPVDGGKSFSLAELNERLMKVREMEEMEIKSFPLKTLRESLVTMSLFDEEQEKKSSMNRLSILGQLGGTPNFMQKPPKDQLVEKYFHPDNMSSTEKLKIELAKVRNDFKMSESDCGSARVQVAQLTTKIKHLSSVLHKKDKHSRKGLVGMVQQRKKLLKYLRRTDWDSYCFVLSKLGLRDNPDYKN